MLRVNIHARERQPRLFFNGVTLTVVENDLAILKVKNPESLKCRERIIWPACLPEQVRKEAEFFFKYSWQDRSYDGDHQPKALLTGWGKIKEGGPWSRYLRKVRIDIVSDQECDNNVGVTKYHEVAYPCVLLGISLHTWPTEPFLPCTYTDMCWRQAAEEGTLPGTVITKY